eukprot:347199_1
MMVCVQLYRALIIVIAVSFGINGFKWQNAKFHQENVNKMKQGWDTCPDWPSSYMSDIYISTWGLTKIHLDNFHYKNNHNVMNITALCKTIQVPLNWNSKSNEPETIDYFITHIFSRNYYDSLGQFWMLNGGPGGDGEELYPTIPPFWQYINGSYDLFIPDHRGTGHSSPIYCPAEIINTEACIDYVNIKWGNKIHYYSTYGASMDLGYAIELFTNITYNHQTIVYGLSYGTYWLNQYIQLFPDQVSAVILDGICPSNLCRYAIYDVNTNNVGRDFMTECEQNQFCASQWNGISPYDAMNNLFYIIDNNNNGVVPCIDYTNSITSQQLRQLFFYLEADFNRRVFIPPIVYRMNRCNQQDVIALNNIFEYFFGDNGLLSNIINEGNVLGLNILLSEMFYSENSTAEPPSTNELLYEDRTFNFATYGPPEMRPLWDIYNKYIPNNTVYNNYGNPSMPMLLLNGDLDPSTPYYWASYVATKYNASIDDIPNGKYYKNRYFLTVPRSTHVTMLGSPMINYTNDEYSRTTCGEYIVKAFIESKDFIPDNSCVNWILPIDWNGVTNTTMQLSEKFFKTTNMWGL